VPAARVAAPVATPVVLKYFLLSAAIVVGIILLTVLSSRSAKQDRPGGSKLPPVAEKRKDTPQAQHGVMDENVGMVRRHPFWDAGVSGSEIDNILREMSAHHTGYLFINSAGKFVYLPHNDPKDALIASDHSALVLWTANGVYPDVHSLGPKMVVIRRFPQSRAQCVRVLNDSISGITLGQAQKMNDNNLKALGIDGVFKGNPGADIPVPGIGF
jgi:hypothetical protein